jgi:uncharacterized protein
VILPILLGAFLAGLLGSVHCVAMCGPFAASCTRAAGGLGLWHIGRVGAYAVLGALAGAAGHTLPGPAWLAPLLATVVIVWFAAGLAGLVPQPSLVPAGLSRLAASAAARPAPLAQLAFGVANGFLPCGLVYAALSVAIATDGALNGALAMVAFGTGTIPALSAAAFGLRRLMTGDLRARRLIALLVLGAGLLAVWARTGIKEVQPHQHRSNWTSSP